MDFAFLAPEVNSARMYSGPGSGTLLAAAASWDSLSAELDTTTQVYESALWGLASLHWRGASAETMAAAAPYIVWLYATSEQAMQTAMQTRAAAAAFELAHAMTVPPHAVAANRAQLAALTATNFFGQNTAAIAATDAQYAEYWAQDATAMYGYAASSAAATQLRPFASPDQTTNQDGVTAQNASVAQATKDVVSNPLSQTVSASEEEQDAADSVSDDSTFFDEAVASFGATEDFANLESFPEEIIGDLSKLGVVTKAGVVAAPEVAPLTAAPQLTGGASGVGSGGGAGLGDVALTVGRTGSIGSMSVPASWSAPSGATVTASPPSGLPTLPETVEPAGSGSAIPGIPGMRPPWRATLVVPRYGVRITVIPRPPCAG